MVEAANKVVEAAEWVVDDMPRELAEKYDFMEKPVSVYYDVVNGIRTAYTERVIYDHSIKIAGQWVSDFFSYGLRRANSNAEDNYAYYNKLVQDNAKAGCESANDRNWFDVGRGVGYAAHDIILMLSLKGLYDLSASLTAGIVFGGGGGASLALPEGGALSIAAEAELSLELSLEGGATLALPVAVGALGPFQDLSNNGIDNINFMKSKADEAQSAGESDACPLSKGGSDTKLVKPEAAVLGSKKHGINWKEGPARAKNTGKPQGQWANSDLDFATEMANTLQPGESGYFDLPQGSESIVHMPDGTTKQATRIWIRNNGTGTWHGYPME